REGGRAGAGPPDRTGPAPPARAARTRRRVAPRAPRPRRDPSGEPDRPASRSAPARTTRSPRRVALRGARASPSPRSTGSHPVGASRSTDRPRRRGRTSRMPAGTARRRTDGSPLRSRPVRPACGATRRPRHPRRRRARNGGLRASRASAPPRRAGARRGRAGGGCGRAARPCSAGGIDQEEGLAELDGVRVLHEDLDDPAGHLGLNLVHELHRFDDAEDLSFLHEIAFADVRIRRRRGGPIEGAHHRRLDRHARCRLDLARVRRGRPLDLDHGRGDGSRSRRDAAALQAHADVAGGHLELRQAQLREQGSEPPHELNGRDLSGRRLARPTSPRHQAPAAATRPRYSPVRVSTLTTSPSLRNNGTWTTAPVSSVAGLVPPWAVSPRTPGSVRAIASSTKFGSSTAAGEPAMYRTSTSEFSLRYSRASPTSSADSETCSYVSVSMKL